LAALVVGSGIAAQTLSPGDAGSQLFENAAALPRAIWRERYRTERQQSW
jgi:hypothetical protein